MVGYAEGQPDALPAFDANLVDEFLQHGLAGVKGTGVKGVADPSLEPVHFGRAGCCD